MGEVIEKLSDKIINKFLPICQRLRDEGLTDQEIDKYLRQHHKKKAFDFYRENNLSGLKTVLTGVFTEIEKADSKIEKILFNLLTGEGIQFKFQYKIGPYRADYLLWGFLVVELDGPQHDIQKKHDQNRDKYMGKMGYKVLRIPTWVLVNKPEDVIKAILEFKPKEKIKKSKTKKVIKLKRENKT